MRWKLFVLACSAANCLDLSQSVSHSVTHAAGQISKPWAAQGFIDTEYWLGSEYTPAGAPSGGLWFHWYDDYAAAVDRELAAMRTQLRVTAIRVWLHDMVFANNSERLLSNMEMLLTSAAKNNVSVGFVFFDDCWNHAGASLDKQCMPQKGTHNGCWMASPQDVDRKYGYEPFKPYVSLTVRRFKDDPRVLWWEVFNEPNTSNAWSLGLRDAAYHWAQAEAPRAPVLSCWDDSKDTDILDHHDYGTRFTKWQTTLYSDPRKGAFITEAGARWFQPEPIGDVNTRQFDQGSPLSVLNFLTALREQKKEGKLPYVPGVMLCWTVFVSNDNTRWHWGTKADSAEPAIPWDGLLFPDGTPVSHTEAGAFRRYVTGVDEFLFFEDFLPSHVADGDVYQKLPAGEMWSASVSTPIREAVVEAALWADGNGDGIMSMIVRAQNSQGLAFASSVLGVPEAQFADASRGPNASFHQGSPLAPSIPGYEISLDSREKKLSVFRHDVAGSVKLLGTCSLATFDNSGIVLSAWNLVRVELSDVSGSTVLRVWVNPMFPETGFVGNASDASRVPNSLPSRLVLADPSPLPPGGIAIAAGVRDSRIDYLSALPIAVISKQAQVPALEQLPPSMLI